MEISRPLIGFFDSGVGGTSIWHAAHQLLPSVHSLYLADSAHAPYGLLPLEALVHRTEVLTEYLLSQGAELIVVACNTATTNAIAHLRARYPVSFVGIEPAIKPATLHTQSQVIGVLATRGTISSGLFHSRIQAFGSGYTLVIQHGDGLVEEIEQGRLMGEQVRVLLSQYLSPMLAQGVDTLVLGCTHYPFLTPVIESLFPRAFQIIDPSDAVARQITHLWHHPTAEQAGQTVFLTNGSLEVMRGFAPEGAEVRQTKDF